MQNSVTILEAPTVMGHMVVDGKDGKITPSKEGESGDPKVFWRIGIKLGGWEERNLAEGSSMQRPACLKPRYIFITPGIGPQVPIERPRATGKG